MNKARRFALGVLILTSLSGCGDSPPVLVHDLCVFWNEMCDYMDRAVIAKSDEEAAKLVNLHFKEKGLLFKKWEKLKDRVEKKMKDFDEAEATALENALLDGYAEIEATEKRIKSCQARLDALITKDTPNLKTIRDWPEGKKVFYQYHYGSPHMPDLKAKPVRPLQIGQGLMPARPTFEKKKPAIVPPK